ncbi:MAG: rhodanese-like domain-containing protein [Chitinophagaceae bacterium]|nr:rhodanese-like domain-containing protein [Chitinophagaceae bacterium]
MIRLLLISVCGCLILIACKNATAHTEGKKQVKAGFFKCLPCGYNCDTILFDGPGSCPHCKMELVKKESIRHQDIQPAGICSLSGEDVVFLDVRTPEEFNGTAAEKFGAIKGAINIPVQELEQRIKELDAYRNKKIVVYCSHSNRSPMASYLLTENGFTNISNMLGGMSVWQEQVKDASCNQRYYQNQQ